MLLPCRCPVARLNLTSGLESFRSGLSGLLTDFQKNGGFWNAASRSENIANAVQLGVKGGLNLVAPIVNGIASSVPIMVRITSRSSTAAEQSLLPPLRYCALHLRTETSGMQAGAAQPAASALMVVLSQTI
jgi:hypothetical protein